MFHVPNIAADSWSKACLFSKSGHKPGPSLAVVGRMADMEKVAARMENIPSLAYMRGSIAIYGVLSDQEANFEPLADDVLRLLDPSCNYASNGAPSATQYWLVLGRAAELGIIAGRGVPVTVQKRRMFG